MMVRTHIIEPELCGEDGHAYSFVDALCSAVDAQPITVWARRNSTFASDKPTIQVEKVFVRRWRRWQLFSLLRRVLAAGERIFLPTAGTTEAFLVGLAAKGQLARNRAFLYVHFVKGREKKRWIYERLARTQPQLVMLGPTDGVLSFLGRCGFQHCRQVPYPMRCSNGLGDDLGDGASTAPTRFSHLLFAGAPRRDKGFAHVVALVQQLRQADRQIPVAVQLAAAGHSYATAVRDDVLRLRDSGYSELRITLHGSTQEQYASLFANAICLQLYDQEAFAERVSGVTLDALLHGCPVITLAGTWIARVVQRFNAGIVLRDAEPATVVQAVDTIVADYPAFAGRARQAGRLLNDEHNARHLLAMLT